MGQEYVGWFVMVTVLKNAVFCHVPKNAGSAISSSIGGVDQYWPMHVPWRCLQDMGKPGFGFVRNPWHRMVSLHYFLQRSPARHLQRVKPEQVRRMGFKRWLMEGENWMSNEPIDGDIWIRQVKKYALVGGKNTYRNIERLEHPVWGMPPQQRRCSMWWLDGLPPENIGRVEFLQEDLSRIAGQLGFNAPNVPQANVTRNKPSNWQSEYDNESIEFVAFHHKPDIDFAGYTFE